MKITNLQMLAIAAVSSIALSGAAKADDSFVDNNAAPFAVKASDYCQSHFTANSEVIPTECVQGLQPDGGSADGSSGSSS